MKFGKIIMAIMSVGAAFASAGTVNVTLQQGVDGYGGCSDAMMMSVGFDTVLPDINFKDSLTYFIGQCFG